MTKEPKEPLFESLEQDIAQLEKEKDDGQVQSGRETDGRISDKESSSDDGARKRVSARRAARKPASPPQDESSAPQKDGGDARGSLGDTSGRSEGTSEDGRPPLGDGSTPSGSGEDGDVLEKPLSPQEAAYHRRIARENAAKIKQLEDELAILKKPTLAAEPAKDVTKSLQPSTTTETLEQWRYRNPEPDKEKDLAGWLVWNAEDGRKWREEQNASYAKTEETRKYETLLQNAEREIDQIQADYRKKNPDFDNALNHGKQEYFTSVKKLMPQYSDAQIEELFKKEILAVALKCNREGTNLGEVLYDMAIERFGYETGSRAPSNTALRPNLRVVASNKKKAASPLAGGGEGAKPRITVEQAADMSPQELMDLDASDWEYLNSQGFN